MKLKITTGIVALCAALGAARAEGGDALAPVQIVLPSTAKSMGLEIFVEEIAEVRCADASVAARVKKASLGYAPAPGYSRTLRADLIEASLAQALPDLDVHVTGAPRCRVSPKVVTLSAKSIKAAAAESLREALREIDAEATPEGALSDLQVPEGAEAPRLVARAERGQIQPGLRNVAVDVWIGDKVYRTVQVPFRLSVWRRTAVLRGAVNVGDALHAGLFEEKRIPIGEARGMQALPLDQLAGAIALRALAPGSLVTERDVHREVVMKKGSQVTVQVKKGSVVVTDVGIVQADGRMGERVRVVLRSTGRELIAAIKSPRLVEVKIQ